MLFMSLAQCFIIMHQTVTNHDAIGNDIEYMYNILSKYAKCYVYAENCLNKKVQYITEENFEKKASEKQTVVIYHHSVLWKHGQDLLEHVEGKIIFKYHNITPAHFFEEYNEIHFTLCDQGRRQTKELEERFPDALWISDSEYNAEDLGEVSKERQEICAPFHKTDEWIQTKPDEGILNKLIQSNTINIMFVGRVVPNKGHAFLLDIVAKYNYVYDKKIKLYIIGKFDEGLPKYNAEIREKISEYGIQEYVEFVGEINDSILASYYLGCDFYVCVSEHEGFCVPIIEAQRLGLPIIALGDCAVPETIGKNQIILDKDLDKFISAIQVIFTTEEYKDYLINQGLENYNKRFSYEKIEERFTYVLKKAGVI